MKRSDNLFLCALFASLSTFGVNAQEDRFTAEELGISEEEYQEIQRQHDESDKALDQRNDEARQKLIMAPKKRARLTEEQAINQLRYMVAQAWKRIQPELQEKGAFYPFGFVLSPAGEVNPVFIKDQHMLKQEVALAGLAQTLEEVASTRTKWGVGLMFIKRREVDGEITSRIEVVSEHIAGWGRYWSYPYKVVDGVAMLGKPVESETKPVYYKR